MGGSYYSDDAARDVRAVRSSKSVDDVFASNKTKKVDPALDPKDLKMRESCDSDNHPESNAIMVMFDVTGSMGDIPAHFARDKQALPALMALLTSKGYIPHPQILFGAIGDAYTDQAPFQIGQFESGNEMDDWLTKVFLEGYGGGQNRESYELAYYAAARHTAIDCFKKRNKKGYLFTIGDEQSYDTVSREQVKNIFGTGPEADIPFKDILEEAQKKYEVFHICVNSRAYDDGHHPYWKDLLGERALMLDEPLAVAELIATTIGACEGRTLESISTDLIAAGSDAAYAAAATKSIIPFTESTELATKPGSVSGDLETSGKPGASTRL